MVALIIWNHLLHDECSLQYSFLVYLHDYLWISGFFGSNSCTCHNVL